MEMAAKVEVKPENLPPTESAAFNHSLKSSPTGNHMGNLGSQLTKSFKLGMERRRWKTETNTDRWNSCSS